MARNLSGVFLNQYKEGGKYHELLEFIKQDKELQFEIRIKNEVMIYFEKCKILTIQHRQMQEDNIIMLDKKYINNRKDKLRLTTFLSSPDDLADKFTIESYFTEAKALIKNYKKHEEFLIQQEFKRTHDSFNDNYLAIDMEWMPDQADILPEDRIDKTRIDLVVINNHVNEEGYNDVYLAELKYGLGATNGESGMNDHLRKSKNIMNHAVICQKLMIDVRCIMKQKMELGLINGTPLKYNLPKRPKMMFILAYRNELERESFQRRVSQLSNDTNDITVEYLHIPEENESDITYQVSRSSSVIAYDNDSAFKAACRRHQAWFRENKLHLPMGENIRTHRAVDESEAAFELRRKTITDTTHLTDEDAMMLMNFAPVFHNEIRTALYQHFGKIPTSHDLMNDMLRSECIPWNFFVPMMQDRESAVSTLRLMTHRPEIKQIVDFKIEYNPKTLDDNTAFDAYFRYLTDKEESGIIGIETKYTEEGYKISPREKFRINNPCSSYCQTMRKSGCFINNDAEVFDCHDFIQIWRNHLLAMSMNIKGMTKYYDSVTIYPTGNSHFHTAGNSRGALDRYSDYLTEEGKKTFHYFTFDDFFRIVRAFYTGVRNIEWLDYIQDRYCSMECGGFENNGCHHVPSSINKPMDTNHKISSDLSKNDTCNVSASKYPLLMEGRKEWVLNLVDYSLYDMLNSGEAKTQFTYDAPKASREVSDKLRYQTYDSFIKAYNNERGSKNDKKNVAYWNFCRKVQTGDIIYLAKGPALYAYGVVIGSEVMTQPHLNQHVWKMEWHKFNKTITIPPNLATPFFIELTDNTKSRKRSKLRYAVLG